MIPVRVGYCRPDELHKLLRKELFRGGIQRKKGKDHIIEMSAIWLPNGSKDAAPTFDLKRLLAEAT